MGLNTAVFNFIHAAAGASGLLDFLGVFCANDLPYLLVLAALVFVFRRRSAKERMFLFVTVGLAGLLSRGFLTEVIRFFYVHPRPFAALGFVPLIPESGNSFPSGHASFFFALAAVIWYFDRRWGWWLLALSLVNGIARVFVGVHWPFDILGGMALGILSAAAAIAALRRFMPAGLTRGAKGTHEEPPVPA